MNKTKTYEALLVISTALLVIYLYGYLKHQESRMLLLYISVGVGLSGIIIRPLGTLIASGWYWLADLLGALMSRVLMTLVFVVVLVPVALLYRLSGKDRLKLRRNAGATWKKRDHLYQGKDLKNIW